MAEPASVRLPKKPSPAQLLVLDAAAADSLIRHDGWGYRPAGTGSYSSAVIQSRTVDICLHNDWLALGERVGGDRRLLLTDKGRAVHARWGGASNGE